MMKKLYYFIIILSAFFLILSCEIKQIENPNQNGIITDTTFNIYNIWYNLDLQVTKYTIADTNGNKLQETTFDITDTCMKVSTIKDSTVYTIYYTINIDGLATMSYDSTNPIIIHSYYFYSQKKRLVKKIDFPVFLLNEEDSMYAATEYEYINGNRRVYCYCFDNQLNGHFSAWSTVFNDYHYYDSVPAPKIDVLNFENGCFGLPSSNLPYEYGTYAFDGPGTGNPWYKEIEFTYEISADSLITKKTDLIFVNKSNKIVVNYFKYFKN